MAARVQGDHSMKLRSFQITAEKQVVGVPVEAGSPAWFEDPVHRWLDIEAPEEDELNALLQPLKIDPEMLRARVEPESSVLFEILENLLFIRIPTQGSSSAVEFTSISLLCLPTTLVTIHHEPLPAISDLASGLAGRVRLKSATTSALVYQLIFMLVAENFLAFGACRQKQEALAKRMIEDSGSIEPEDIFTLRRQITNIGDANEDHAFCVDVLQKVESTSFDAGEQREHLKELVRSLERLQRFVGRLEENVKDLHQHFLLAIQERTGNRLKVLTILSAVFLPLTLIAGIYGMNFENMPELGVRYAYYGVLGFMVLVAIGMLGFFYKQGWFD
jgi:magnesium transporter